MGKNIKQRFKQIKIYDDLDVGYLNLEITNLCHLLSRIQANLARRIQLFITLLACLHAEFSPLLVILIRLGTI